MSQGLGLRETILRGGLRLGLHRGLRLTRRRGGLLRSRERLRRDLDLERLLRLLVLLWDLERDLRLLNEGLLDRERLRRLGEGERDIIRRGGERACEISIYKKERYSS